VGVEAAQGSEISSQRLGQVAGRRHRRTTVQDRDHVKDLAVSPPMEGAGHFVSDEIDLAAGFGSHCPPVDFGQPVRPDQHQDHSNPVDLVGQPLRKILPAVDVAEVEEQLGLVVEPARQAVVQVQRVAAGVGSPVADEDAAVQPRLRLKARG
jgi:hypothetical protein